MDTILVCPQMPSEDSFALISREQILPGGSCANTLVNFTFLGGQSSFAAKIGDDETGRLFRKSLIDDGVDDTHLLVKKGGSSMCTYILAFDGGKHSILVNFGDSVNDLQIDEISSAFFAEGDIFYGDFIAGAVTVSIANKCRELGKPVVLCLECAPSLLCKLGLKDEQITQGLALADLIISGREGFQELTGHSDYQKSVEEIDRRFNPAYGVVCTAGEQGAVWYNHGELLTAPIFTLKEIVDSTGAGDSFLAALLYSVFCRQDQPNNALQFASAAGALKCSVFGPRLRASASDVLSFIQNNY